MAHHARRLVRMCTFRMDPVAVVSVELVMIRPAWWKLDIATVRRKSSHVRHVSGNKTLDSFISLKKTSCLLLWTCDETSKTAARVPDAAACMVVGRSIASQKRMAVWPVAEQRAGQRYRQNSSRSRHTAGGRQRMDRRDTGLTWRTRACKNCRSLYCRHPASIVCIQRTKLGALEYLLVAASRNR
jgi:hypothetical protein